MKTALNHIRFIFILSFFLGESIDAAIDDYILRSFTPDDGLTQQYIYSISQDYYGCLWIGTADGLFSYNGLQFKSHTIADSLSDNFITCTVNDGKGIWIGHMNGALTYYDGKIFKKIPTHIENGGPATCLISDYNDRIWMSLYNGGLLLLNKEMGIARHYSVNADIQIVSFDFIDQEHLLVATESGLAFCKLSETGSVELLNYLPGIPVTRVVQILRMRSKQGYFVATANEGIFTVYNQRTHFNVVSFKADSTFVLTGIQSLYEDSHSNLWVSTFGNGMIKIEHDTQVTEQFSRYNGLNTDNVKLVFEDQEGNIWCGGYGNGLTRLTARRFEFHTMITNGADLNIVAVNGSPKSLWAANENILFLLDKKTGTVIRSYNDIFPGNIITALYVNTEDEIWLGTESQGLYKMNATTGKISRYHISEGQLENSITSITSSKGRIWIGTKKGVCSIDVVNDLVNWYSISNGGLPHNSINSVFADTRGRIWISSRSNILAYIEQGKIFKFRINSGAKSFGPFAEDFDSAIWAGSLGNGVYKITKDSVINITIKDGLISDFCYAMEVDKNGFVWVGHKGGMSRITTGNLFVKAVDQFESTGAGNSYNANAMYSDPFGIIWSGTDKGIISYNPDAEFREVRNPVARILSLRINEQEVPINRSIILKPGTYRIKIEFLAISLREQEQMTYQVQMKGVDDFPVYTRDNIFNRSNLTEGRYVFELMAISSDGNVSEEPVLLEIKIRAPLWHLWWFYPVLALCLVIFAVLLMKRREYHFMTEKVKLENLVQERTKEISEKKDEIEKQGELIRAKNAEITSSIRYARKIQTAVLPSAPLMSQYIPESFIYLSPKDIVSGDFYWLSQKDNKVVFTVADCTGHGVPGAFLSLLSITMLNDIVNSQGITTSDSILNELHSRINHSLNKSKMDGLDMALCVWDKQNSKIQYSGAMNHLVYIRNGQLEIVKANQFSVNSYREDFRPFTRQEIDVLKGDVFYMYTDGFMDQFGGDRDKKFSIRRFYDLLLEIHHLSMHKQEAMLQKNLMSWKRDKVQTDDITVMGVRF